MNNNKIKTNIMKNFQNFNEFVNEAKSNILKKWAKPEDILKDMNEYAHLVYGSGDDGKWQKFRNVIKELENFLAWKDPSKAITGPKFESKSRVVEAKSASEKVDGQIEKMKSELSSELDSISNDLNVAKNNFNYNRHHRDYRGDDAYEFDIKMHGAPNIDFEELADEYFGGDVDKMDFAFREYLVKEVEDFVEMLQNDQKIDWIKDYFQVGRMGGWLVLTLNDYTWSDGDVSDTIDEIESQLIYHLDDYFEGDINLSSIKKEFKKSMEEVDKFRNDADNHISQLQEIEKLIKIAKEEVGPNFKDSLK